MHILVARNNFNSGAVDASLLLVAYLSTQGISYTLIDMASDELGMNPTTSTDEVTQPCDLVIALGGDGTILRTARLAQVLGCPILGINFGHLGFLANPNDCGVIEIVAAALADDVKREARANLCVSVLCEGDDEEEATSLVSAPPFEVVDGEQRTFFALNEVAINRGNTGRIIDFGLSIAGEHLVDLRGDGVIVSTATGSTAYALSAGGPLVSPTYPGLVVVPLAPHSLQSRAIVTDSNDIVEIDLIADGRPREAELFVDGEKLEFKDRVTKVFIRKGPDPTILLRYQHENFYKHLSDTFFK